MSSICEGCHETYTASPVLLASLKKLSADKRICFKCFINDGFINDSPKDESSNIQQSDVQQVKSDNIFKDYRSIRPKKQKPITYSIGSIPETEVEIDDIGCDVCKSHIDMGCKANDESDDEDKIKEYVEKNKIIIKFCETGGPIKNVCIPCAIKGDCSYGRYNNYLSLMFCEICGHLFEEEFWKTCWDCKKDVGPCCGAIYSCQCSNCICKDCCNYLCEKCNKNKINDECVYVDDGDLDTRPWCENCKDSSQLITKI